MMPINACIFAQNLTAMSAQNTKEASNDRKVPAASKIGEFF